MDRQGLMVHGQLTRTERQLEAVTAERDALRRENEALRATATAVLERAEFERDANGRITRCEWDSGSEWFVWERSWYANMPFLSALVALREALDEATK